MSGEANAGRSPAHSRLAQLRKQQQVFAAEEAVAGFGHWEWGELAGRMTYCSPGLARMFGMTAEEYLERASSPEGDMLDVEPEDRERYYRTVFDPETPYEFDIEYRTCRPDGSALLVREIGLPLFDEAGRCVRTIGFVQDVTEQRAMEEALREARDDLEARVAERTAELRKREVLFRRACEASRLGYWTWDPDADLMTVSAELARMLHLPEPHEFPIRHEDFIERYVHPDDRTLVLDEWDLPETPMRFELEFRVVRNDGGTLWVHEVGEVVTDEHGRCIAEVGLIRDITEERESEARLRQTQKLEAVGQLTGGVAHDFNNLLTVVTGNLDVAIERLAEGRDAEACLQDALDAALRGADLVRKLLTFSGRRSVQVAVGDVNEAIHQTTDLLERVLGEEYAIEKDLCPHPCLAEYDSAQLENALVNLVLNARDAMTGGGTLRIETDLSVSGAAACGGTATTVVVTVRDCGLGMTPKVRERALEPFFTTKEVGQGSGLGLSMVYGFVEGCGGRLEIESERGRGTAVHMHLPRAHKAPPPRIRLREETPGASKDEVLLVEDQEPVRRVIAQNLRALGYGVIEARDGREAGIETDAHPEIDLVLSDVVLPGGVDGREVVARAQSKRSDVKVLLMSGYERRPRGVDRRPTRIPILSKPFTMAQLASAVRARLDSD